MNDLLDYIAVLRCLLLFVVVNHNLLRSMDALFLKQQAILIHAGFQFSKNFYDRRIGVTVALLALLHYIYILAKLKELSVQVHCCIVFRHFVPPSNRLLPYLQGGAERQMGKNRKPCCNQNHRLLQHCQTRTYANGLHKSLRPSTSCDEEE